MATMVHEVFRALGDPTRREVVTMLSQGSASVSELAEPFEMALPSFVQHLRVLEESGIIRSSKAGRVRTCSLVPAGLAVAEDWLHAQRRVWEERADRFAAYAEELERSRS